MEMSDDYEKPSWSDVDKRKDKGGHFEKKQMRPSAKNRDQSLAKKNLEQLFTPKSNKEQAKEIKALKTLKGALFEKQALIFVKKFGFPKNPQDLFTFLDLEDEQQFIQLLDHIESIALNWPKTTKEMFIGKLRIQAMMLEDLEKAIQKTIQTLT